MIVPSGVEKFVSVMVSMNNMFLNCLNMLSTDGDAEKVAKIKSMQDLLIVILNGSKLILVSSEHVQK